MRHAPYPLTAESPLFHVSNRHHIESLGSGFRGWSAREEEGDEDTSSGSNSNSGPDGDSLPTSIAVALVAAIGILLLTLAPPPAAAAPTCAAHEVAMGDTVPTARFCPDTRADEGTGGSLEVGTVRGVDRC